MSTAAVVDVPQTVADWLVTFGVLHHGKTVMNAKGEHLRQISGAEWAPVASGFAVGRVLSAFFDRLGVQEALPALREGNDLQVRAVDTPTSGEAGSAEDGSVAFRDARHKCGH